MLSVVVVETPYLCRLVSNVDSHALVVSIRKRTRRPSALLLLLLLLFTGIAAPNVRLLHRLRHFVAFQSGAECERRFTLMGWLKSRRRRHPYLVIT